MDHLNRLKLTIVGDFRVNTLIRESDKSRYQVEVVSSQNHDLLNICHKIDEVLAESDTVTPNLLVVIALHNDIVSHSGIDSSTDVMRLNKKFKFEKTMSTLLDFNNKWKATFQNLDIVWTVPAVPDFLRYNTYLCFLVNEERLKKELELEQVTYKQISVKIVEKFKENNLSYIDLNKITRYRGKRLKLFREVQEVPTVTFVDKVLTSDGVHPQTRMAERFIRMLSQFMKIVHRKRNYDIGPNNSGLQTDMEICDSKDDEGLMDLWSDHIKTWEKYRKTPESFPEYHHHKQVWLYGLVQLGKPTKNSEKKWENYWQEKLDQMFHCSWEAKQKKYKSEKSSLSSTTSSLSDPITPYTDANDYKKSSLNSTSTVKAGAKDKKSSLNSTSTVKAVANDYKKSSLDSTPTVKAGANDYAKSSSNSTSASKSTNNKEIHNIYDTRFFSDSLSYNLLNSSTEESSRKSPANESYARSSMKSNHMESRAPESENYANSSVAGDYLDSGTPENKKYANVADITSSLCAISSRLGTFGVTLSVIHSKVVECVNKGTNPFDCIDEDAKLLLDLIKGKITKLLRDSDPSSPDHFLFQKTLDNLEKFIHMLEQQEENKTDLIESYGLELDSLLKALNDRNETQAIGFLETVLAYKGHTDISQDELRKIYLIIKRHGKNA